MTIPAGIVKATYRDTGVARYKGNPLIEALPPIRSVRQIRHGMAQEVEVRESDIQLESQTRFHIISQLLDGFFQPLARHIELESKLSLMIRQGYVGRNLATGELNSHIQNGYERIMQGDLGAFRFDHVESTAKSLSFIGCSGSGKTVSIHRILSTYPQVIFHEKYNFTQIVFLKIDCPHDGSLKSLCHNFFREIDDVLATDFVKRYVEKRHSIENLIAMMAHIANTYAVGLLVIDEIQHLNARHSGGAERMLNFFVTLVNEISVPVVMVGTPKARPIFELDLRSARRGAGFGAILWEPLKSPGREQDVSNTEWGRFTSRLWEFQWLRKTTPAMLEDVRDTWFELSQGIMDIVIKLFVLSQIRAVVTGTERITSSLMRKVYQDELKPIHPMIDALSSGDTTRIAQYSDLTIPSVDAKLLQLSEMLQSNTRELKGTVSRSGPASRLHSLLVEMGYESDILDSLVTRAFREHPERRLPDVLPTVLKWYQEVKDTDEPSSHEVTILSQDRWPALESVYLRHIFALAEDGEELASNLEHAGYFITAADLDEAQG